MNPTLVVIVLIVFLYIVEPEFFELLPEWVVLWGKMLRLNVEKKIFRYNLRRQMAKDRKEIEEFTKDFQKQNGERTEDRL